MKPGDNIQVGTNKGVVQDVTWRHATIKNRNGETVIIPQFGNFQKCCGASASARTSECAVHGTFKY